ncbi:MAG: hypothetical protein Q8936_19965 [Bacillota bacterium]|nr:hypothetical protein [Bacillota bacterium]
MCISMGDKKIFIVDRSLPVILRKNKTVNSQNLIDYSLQLKKVGTDLLEVDANVVSSIGDLPDDINYIFRIKNKSDFIHLNKGIFKYFIINFKDILSLSIRSINQINKLPLILELDKEDLYYNDDEELNIIGLKAFKNVINFDNLRAIRIQGLSKCILYPWEKIISDIKREFDVKVDICADNRINMGTAVALEACMAGPEFITTAFYGCGGDYGYAPLEEVITALPVISGLDVEGEIKYFMKLSKLYEQITGVAISKTKAILGEDIFNYESGIHADGIEKAPLTYEPFDPAMVGQNRKMIIGKHSGSKAITIKLNQLSVNYSVVDMNTLLKQVREKSIELKRGILDDELVQMCCSQNESSFHNG